jgi:hypothetical protein
MQTEIATEKGERIREKKATAVSSKKPCGDDTRREEKKRGRVRRGKPAASASKEKNKRQREEAII